MLGGNVPCLNRWVKMFEATPPNHGSRPQRPILSWRTWASGWRRRLENNAAVTLPYRRKVQGFISPYRNTKERKRTRKRKRETKRRRRDDNRPSAVKEPGPSLCLGMQADEGRRKQVEGRVVAAANVEISGASVASRRQALVDSLPIRRLFSRPLSLPSSTNGLGTCYKTGVLIRCVTTVISGSLFE